VGQAHRFYVVLGQHSSYTVEYSPDKRQEGNWVGLVVRLTEMWMKFEGYVNLLVLVTILFEGIPQEHQPDLQDRPTAR
jgi:hypothetical protein